MNATWYSWGYGHVRASTFVAAWRHIVSLFRAQGADNVTWLWTINQDLNEHRADWSPGGQARAMSPGSASTATTTVRPTPSPPCSARPLPRSGRSPASRCCCPRQPWGPAPIRRRKSGTCSPGMHQYQTLGLVWFDIAQHQGIYHQDWRVEDHPAAETAFRLARPAAWRPCCQGRCSLGSPHVADATRMTCIDQMSEHATSSRTGQYGAYADLLKWGEIAPMT